MPSTILTQLLEEHQSLVERVGKLMAASNLDWRWEGSGSSFYLPTAPVFPNYEKFVECARKVSYFKDFCKHTLNGTKVGTTTEGLRKLEIFRKRHELTKAKEAWDAKVAQAWPDLPQHRSVIKNSWSAVRIQARKEDMTACWNYKGDVQHVFTLVPESLSLPKIPAVVPAVPHFHIRKGLRALDQHGLETYLYFLFKLRGVSRRVVHEEVMRQRPGAFQ